MTRGPDSRNLSRLFVVPQNPDTTRANLISRMAKMGQPMLPFLRGAPSQPESSDSELEVGGEGGVVDGTSPPSPPDPERC